MKIEIWFMSLTFQSCTPFLLILSAVIIAYFLKQSIRKWKILVLSHINGLFTIFATLNLIFCCEGGVQDLITSSFLKGFKTELLLQILLTQLREK